MAMSRDWAHEAKRNSCRNVSSKNGPDEVPDGKQQACSRRKRMILIVNGRELD